MKKLKTKLVQCNIATAIEKWIKICEKKKASRTTSAIIIEISSDEEEATNASRDVAQNATATTSKKCKVEAQETPKRSRKRLTDYGTQRKTPRLSKRSTLNKDDSQTKRSDNIENKSKLDANNNQGKPSKADETAAYDKASVGSTSTCVQYKHIQKELRVQIEAIRNVEAKNSNSTNETGPSNETLLNNTPTASESAPSGPKQATTPSSGKYLSKTVKNESASPKKLRFQANSSSSPTKDKKMNLRWLKLITDLFRGVYNSSAVNNLSPTHKARLELFFSMDDKYQYVCLKLFTWQRKWYNIYKFCELNHVCMDRHEVSTLYNFLKSHSVIDTSYREEGVIRLLELLDTDDIKSICETFRIKKGTRMKRTSGEKLEQPAAGGKKNMINNLLEICGTQSTLSLKSTEEVLMEQIHRRMGDSVMLNEGFYDTFYMTYVLGTFANHDFAKIGDYSRHMQEQRVVFPEKPVHEYTVFYSRDEFSRYITAHQYRYELEKVREKKPFNHVEYLKLCESVFDKLKSLGNVVQHDHDRYKEAPHLIRFTAEAIYVSALSAGAKTLTTKYPVESKRWLEYMIQNNTDFPHRIGDWYHELSWLYIQYLQPKDYDYAAKLLIDVLKSKRQHLTLIQLHQLAKRAQKLFTSKLRISQLNHDTIVGLLPTSLDEGEIPSTTIDAHAIRSNESGRKRNYMVRDTQGNKSYLSVEEQALQHYLDNCGYTDGKHCEGRLVVPMFALLFWDVIYNSQQVVPGAFVLEIQSQPLDMSTKHFYPNRKEAIDRRLKEIEQEWSQAEIVAFLKNNYMQHSHEESFCGEVGQHIENPKTLYELLECVGRPVLSEIFKRLAQDFRHHRSGMPDLLVWNPIKKKSKFVEVKGENDRLSIGQTLWLKHLKDIGAEVEVCHVHSMGSKRKQLKDGRKGKE